MDRHEDPAPTRSQPRLLDQVRGVIRRLHYYSIRTEQAYVDWIRRFILVHRKRHPKEMGVPEVEAFLTPPPAGRKSCITGAQRPDAM